MEKVIWSDRALADLEHIVRYIAFNNPEAAIRLGQGIIDNGSAALAVTMQ